MIYLNIQPSIDNTIDLIVGKTPLCNTKHIVVRFRLRAAFNSRPVMVQSDEILTEHRLEQLPQLDHARMRNVVWLCVHVVCLYCRGNTLFRQPSKTTSIYQLSAVAVNRVCTARERAIDKNSKSAINNVCREYPYGISRLRPRGRRL